MLCVLPYCAQQGNAVRGSRISKCEMSSTVHFVTPVTRPPGLIRRLTPSLRPETHPVTRQTIGTSSSRNYKPVDALKFLYIYILAKLYTSHEHS
jgi:hypothetical protein